MLTGKPTGERRLGGPRHRWEDSIRIDLKEIGRQLVREIGLIRLRKGVIGEPL